MAARSPSSATTAGGKLGNIQALRAYAALAVVLDHLTDRSTEILHRPLLSHAFGWGATGVDTFFVLSGFIIMTVHRSDLGRPGQLKPYLIKRAVRIYPIYWLVTIAALPIYLAGYGTATKRSVDVFVRSFTLFPQHPGIFPIVNVGWTLSYEVFFYLVFALLIVLPRRISPIPIALWLVPCFIVMVLFDTGLHQFPFSLLYVFLFSPRNLEFALGMAIAVAGPRLAVRCPRVLVGVGLVIILVVGFLSQLKTGFEPFHGDPVIPYGLPSGLMVLGAAHLDREGAHAPRVLEKIGDSSYSLYLIHFAIITLVFQACRHLHLVDVGTFPLVVAIAGIASVVGALLCYRWVETPLLRWGRRRFLPERTAHAATVST